MTAYGSWISVSDFYIQVDAKDMEDAKKKIMDELEGLIVRVMDEDENGYTNLDCEIKDIECMRFDKNGKISFN